MLYQYASNFSQVSKVRVPREPSSLVLQGGMMAKRILVAAAALAVLVGGRLPAQQFPPGYVDPAPLLAAAAKEIGEANFKCVTFSGVGYSGAVGQTVENAVNIDWPPLFVPRQVVQDHDAHRLDADRNRTIVRQERRRMVIAGRRPRFHHPETVIETRHVVGEI